jgi:hypothetical protein
MRIVFHLTAHAHSMCSALLCLGWPRSWELAVKLSHKYCHASLVMPQGASLSNFPLTGEKPVSVKALTRYRLYFLGIVYYGFVHMK